MKKLLVLLLMGILVSSPAFAKRESSSEDATSVLLYGKYNDTLVPIKVSSDGTVGAGGGGTPGGSDTQVQFNNAGAFEGDAGLTYNSSTDVLTAGSYATAASTDPYSIYDVSTATDYDYWQGVSSDNDSVADTSDIYQIGIGTTAFTTPVFQLFNTGGMTWGDGTSNTHTFKWRTAYTTADPSQILTSTSTSVKSSTTGWVVPASSSSQVAWDMQGTFNGALTSTAIGYGQRSKWTFSGAASNEIYSLTGDTQMTNTSGTQAEAVGVYGWGTRNGAGGTTTTFYGVKGEAATVTAGTLTNNYAGGFEGRIRFLPDARTIADDGNGGTAATLTLNPTSGVVEITCSDAQGCDVTMGETGVLDGTPVRIYNLSANAVNFADTAGVTELTGAVALGQYDSLTITYVTDRWIMDSTSNN